MSPNQGQNTINILKNFVIPEPQHGKTVPPQTSISPFIILLIIPMLATVELDDHLGSK